MRMQLNEAELSLVETAKGFAVEHIAPFAAQWEAERRVPREMFLAAAEAGLTGVLVPRELGGEGARFVTAARVLEELASSCLAATFALWVHNNAVNGIARSASRDQIDRLVEPMLRAERIGAFCLTEPGAGSDAAAIETRATKIDDGWRIDGEKSWVTNGAHADVLVVFAQTDPSLGWRGIGSFVVDAAREGVSRTPPYRLIGGHAMGVSGLRFDGCEISGGDLLLGPGDGFKAAMNGINHARMCVGAVCCGALGASLDYALAHAAERRAFGKPVLSFQGLQWELADVATDLQAARLLTYDAAQALDRGEAAIMEAAHAKKFASKVALTGISQCMQAMGAVGAMMEHAPARHMATAKLTQYLDGTTEIQNIVISRELLKGSVPDAR